MYLNFIKAFRIFLLVCLFFFSFCKKKNSFEPQNNTSTAPGSLNNSFELINTQNSPLLSDTIHDLFVFNNRLFICTAKGLSIFSVGTWNHYTSSNSGLSSNKINCCFITDTVWWIGTDNGLIKHNTLLNNWISYTTFNSPLPSDKIRSLWVDKNNTLWLGTFSGGGVAKYNNNTWQVFTPSNSPLPSNSVATVYAQDSLYWFGTGGGLVRYNGNNWNIYHPGNSGISSAWIYDITEGIYPDHLWIATNNGINYFNISANLWQSYNSSNSGLIGNFTRKLFLDKTTNTLWIATDGNGLFRFDGNNWKQYKYNPDNIPSNYLSDVVSYNGKIWIATKEKGLAYLK